MSDPATRLGDEAVCLLHADEVRPYSGSWLCQVNHRWAVRFGDPGWCARGHRAYLAEGAAHVLIDGKPASRFACQLTDTAAGHVVAGSENVFIGGPTVSLPTNLSVEGHERFRATIFSQLGLIAGTKSGRKLFAAIQAAAPGRQIRIVEGVPGQATVRDENGHVQPIRRGLELDPYVIVFPHNLRDGYANDHYEPNLTDDVILFHELVHANGAAHGYAYGQPGVDGLSHRKHAEARSYYASGEKDGIHCNRKSRCTCEYTNLSGEEWCGEHRAVGTYPYDEVAFSENTYRDERGHKPREHYHRPKVGQ